MSNQENNKKYKDILETGQELFWKFGFRRVSIEEICKEAGISKMTFYKYFSNKLDLAITILDRISKESLVKIKNIREDHHTPAQTFKKILQLKSESTQGIGTEFIKDVYANPESELKSHMKTLSDTHYAEVLKVFQKGQIDGWVRKDLNIPFCFSYIMNSMDVLNDGELLSYFDTSQELIMEITNLFVYGISPHE